jgi:hypothetical protein
MARIRARERIQFHQDINIAINPTHAKEYRLDLGEVAWDDDDPAFAHYVHGIASEGGISTSE